MTLTTKEIWKSIHDFPGYEVSDRGRVRSFWRQTGNGYRYGGKFVLDTAPQRILTQSLANRGRPSVTLCVDGKTYTKLVHKLVLLTFVGPCPPGMEACHNDGDDKNNDLTNLRWDTHINNEADKERHGTLLMGEKRYNSKVSEADVLFIRYYYSRGVSQGILAAQFGVDQTNISQIVLRKTWKHI